MKVVLLFGLCVAFVYSQVPVPDGAILAVTNAGIPTLSAEIKDYNELLERAIVEFQPINTTCMTKLDNAINQCRTCVEQKCTDRAQSVCKPEQWQVILAKTIGFFKDGVPGFFKDTIPDVFVNKIGGGVVDVTKDIGNFFKDTIGGGVIDAGKTIGNGVVDIGKNIGDGVVDFGKGIGNGVVDLGKTIGNGVVDVGNKIKDGVVGAVDKIKDFGSKIGDAFGDLFGKREIPSRFVKRQAEPSCDDFQNDANAACQTYLNPSFCGICGFDTDKDCPGYPEALAKIQQANKNREWMTKITNQKYNILSMSFNPANMDATGGFKDVAVKIQIFGKEFSFNVDQPINPYIPNVAGPAIAKQALRLFKAA